MEAKIAQDGIQLNHQQITALECKHEDDVACGEIETAHPDYLLTGYVLCRQFKGHWSYLLADFYGALD